MKIDITSDIHVDLNRPHDWSKTQGADTIVIAGDISNSVVRFGLGLSDIAKAYENVLVVPGNHDFYDTREHNLEVPRAMALLKEQCFALPNVFLLDYGNATIDGITFIGNIGWYDLVGPPDTAFLWRKLMNDYRFIDLSGADEVRRLAASCAQQIDERLAHAERAVVVTHMAPCVAAMNPEHLTNISPAYVNTLMEPVMVKHASRIAAWVFGHTHEPVDMVHPGCGVPILSHPRGYWNQSRFGTTWTGPRTIEV